MPCLARVDAEPVYLYLAVGEDVVQWAGEVVRQRWGMIVWNRSHSGGWMGRNKWGS